MEDTVARGTPSEQRMGAKSPVEAPTRKAPQKHQKTAGMVLPLYQVQPRVRQPDEFLGGRADFFQVNSLPPQLPSVDKGTAKQATNAALRIKPQKEIRSSKVDASNAAVGKHSAHLDIISGIPMSNKMLTIQKVINNGRGADKAEKLSRLERALERPAPSSSSCAASQTTALPGQFVNATAGSELVQTLEEEENSHLVSHDENGNLVEDPAVLNVKAESFSGKNEEQPVKLTSNTVRLVNPVGGADHGVGGRLEGILYGRKLSPTNRTPTGPNAFKPAESGSFMEESSRILSNLRTKKGYNEKTFLKVIAHNERLHRKYQYVENFLKTAIASPLAVEKNPASSLSFQKDLEEFESQAREPQLHEESFVLRGVLPSIQEIRKNGGMTAHSHMKKAQSLVASDDFLSVERMPPQKLPAVKPQAARNSEHSKKSSSLHGRGLSPPPAGTVKTASFSPEKPRKPKEKPQAKIKILQERYKHLDKHPVNCVIRQINKFIAQAFKHQNTNIAEIAKSARILGIPLPRNYSKDAAFLKSKEFQVLSKEKLLKRLYKTLNESNKLRLAPPDHSSNVGPQFRFFIGKGNNFLLVRGILK